MPRTFIHIHGFNPERASQAILPGRCGTDHAYHGGFQSRTGFTGHLASPRSCSVAEAQAVSIPDGLPRPFSRRFQWLNPNTPYEFQSRTGSPGHLAQAEILLKEYIRTVSIPNGLHRPFSHDALQTVFQQELMFQSRTGSTGHLAGYTCLGC